MPRSVVLGVLLKDAKLPSKLPKYNVRMSSAKISHDHFRE